MWKISGDYDAVPKLIILISLQRKAGDGAKSWTPVNAVGVCSHLIRFAGLKATELKCLDDKIPGRKTLK